MTVRISGAIGTADGGRPPRAEQGRDRLQPLRQGLDRGPADLRRRASSSRRRPRRPWKRCGGALVGHGKFKANVDFSGREPVAVTGDMLAFNCEEGRQAGAAAPRIRVPAGAAGLRPHLQDRPRQEGHLRHDLRRPASPNIASKLGYVTNVNLTFGRRYTYEGQQRSFLSARARPRRAFPGRSSPSPAAASPSPTGSASAPRWLATAGSVSRPQACQPGTLIGRIPPIVRRRFRPASQASIETDVSNLSSLKGHAQDAQDRARGAWFDLTGPRGWRSVAGPAAFAVVSIALLVYDHLQQKVPHIVFWLALVLIGTRLRLDAADQPQAVTERSRNTTATPSATGSRASTTACGLETDIEAAVLDPADRRVLLIFDLDGLQTYNDRFGYAAGDELLRRIAQTLVHQATPLGRHRLPARRQPPGAAHPLRRQPTRRDRPRRDRRPPRRRQRPADRPRLRRGRDPRRSGRRRQRDADRRPAARPPTTSASTARRAARHTPC